jgi:hypothetical protein
MDLTTCPECAAPAEITDRFVLESTAGPVDHARVRCVRGHWFLLSVQTLERAHRRSLDRTRR